MPNYNLVERCRSYHSAYSRGIRVTRYDGTVELQQDPWVKYDMNKKTDTEKSNCAKEKKSFLQKICAWVNTFLITHFKGTYHSSGSGRPRRPQTEREREISEYNKHRL